MFKPKKSLGQNFLTDKSVATQMVNALEIDNGDDVIEIGPGRGIVTTYLTEKSKPFDTKIFAVELDTRLYRELNELYSEEHKVKIVNENILDWLPEFSTDRNIKIIGSIPYYITSPIIHKIIKMRNLPETVVLLVQKEVAEKIKDRPPDSSYMSSFIQTFFEVKYLGKVPSKKFNPEPQVDGGILKMTKRGEGFTPEFIRKYEGFLHRAYSNPRKMLNKVFRQEELEKGKIDPRLRAQNLGAEEWLNFYKVLNEV
jgi:16S rRNA (adenine1518-N6/adenine1519-N6)-dimethyltransferase